MNDYARAPNQSLLTTSSPTFAGLTINGAATFAATVTATGQFLAGNGSEAAPSYSFASAPTTGIFLLTSAMEFSVGGASYVRIGGNSLSFRSQVRVGWGSGLPGYDDLQLARLGPASLQQGLIPSATPVAQTFTIGEASRPGTDVNVGGANGTIRSGLGTGTGTPSALIFQTPAVAAAGSGVQTYATRLTLDVNGALVAGAIEASGQVFTAGDGSFSFVSRARVYSPSDGVIRLSNAAADGFTMLQFGGTTSSFPALRRAGAVLEAVKADESDYATFRCSAIRDANNVQVLGTQGAAVADASGGATVDAEARTAINTLLARLRAHGLVAT